MKKQCNLCGLRNDTSDLAQTNRTWCLVYDKEVDNKQPGCEYWRPQTADKVQVANEIKRSIREQVVGREKEQVESKRHTEIVDQHVLDRGSAERTAKRAFKVSIVCALIALASCIAAWVAVFHSR